MFNRNLIISEISISSPILSEMIIKIKTRTRSKNKKIMSNILLFFYPPVWKLHLCLCLPGLTQNIIHLPVFFMFRVDSTLWKNLFSFPASAPCSTLTFHRGPIWMFVWGSKILIIKNHCFANLKWTKLKKKFEMYL